MVFTSFPFLAFFSVFWLGFLCFRKRGTRQLWVLISSIFFYGYWKVSYLLILGAPSVVDYICAVRIEDAPTLTAKRFWLTVSVLTNLGLLGYFKYTNFFIETFAKVIGVRPHRLNILLPIGISFFVFKTLSY